MKASQLRAIPAVERVLQALGDAGLPRPVVLAVVRRELAAIRRGKKSLAFDELLTCIRASLRDLRASRIQPLINGTGILVHTNFGRAPLGPGIIETLSRVGANYVNLEYGLIGGARSGRATYLEHSLALLCEAEAATAVNNNAAALVLILRHFCRPAGQPGNRESRRDEVIISRGELIQIGGGFRIPEILESSGARLSEVGTTNKTSIQDYARAMNRGTALILKVHRSNFFMGGFVESPPAEEIAALAHRKRVPFVEDLGSGAMIQTQAIAGLEHEPTPAEVIRRGADLVCFSGDKLLGGPQAGLIAGKQKLVAALKRDPFFRALRCDKLILSALETAVDIYLGGCGVDSSDVRSSMDKEPSPPAKRLDATIPVLEMLQVPIEELRARADRIVSALHGLPINIRVGVGQAQIGGGTLPRSVVASVTLDLIHAKMNPQEFASRLRDQPVPVVGYVARGMLKLDLRTVFPRQDAELIQAIRVASG
ncbi:MAG TPA: L-seryl-tRNA(Sec) selenium transferase [Candidatus Acidoferrales bacterium]|nr:L-seryl-tRNA(Sec) selenium transferase [Candidatus Acidoferrales bacterium]